MVVARLRSKPGQVGSAFALALAGRIQSAKADDQVAHGGQVLDNVASVSRRTIFAEGDIAHVMDGVFKGPVPPAEALNLSGIHFLGRTAAENDFSLFGDAHRLEVMSGAGNDRRLSRVRESGAFGSHGEGIDLAGLMPAVALAQRDVRREKIARWGHGEGGEFVKELGLIAFDDQEVVGLFFFDDESGAGFLSIEGVGAHQGPAQVQVLEEIFEGGNLVGFGRDLDLAADDFGLDVQGAEQLDRLALDFGGGANGFSVDGQGDNAQIVQMRAQPVGDDEVQLGRVQALQDPADGLSLGARSLPVLRQRLARKLRSWLWLREREKSPMSSKVLLPAIMAAAAMATMEATLRWRQPL